MIVKLNLSFYIIADKNFRKLFFIFRFQLIISYRTELVNLTITILFAKQLKSNLKNRIVYL